MPERPEKFLKKTDNYRALHAYPKAEVLYDFTFRFSEKFLAKGDRTRDQRCRPRARANKTLPKAIDHSSQEQFLYLGSMYE